jgi:hypothetical protein
MIYAIIGVLIGVLAICLILFCLRRGSKKLNIISVGVPGRVNSSRIVSFRGASLYSAYSKEADIGYTTNPSITSLDPVTFPEYFVDFEDPNGRWSESNVPSEPPPVRFSFFGSKNKNRENPPVAPPPVDLSRISSLSTDNIITHDNNSSEFDTTGVSDEFTRPSAWKKNEEIESGKKKKKTKCIIS